MYVRYTEAGPWQYRVEVPYDPMSLKAALNASGYDGCDIIQQANSIGGAFHFGGYGSEIHEMSEMAINCWGQWELNNQPVWALQHMQVVSACGKHNSNLRAFPTQVSLHTYSLISTDID